MTGKVESRWGTTTALGIRNGEVDVFFGRRQTFFYCEYVIFGGGCTIFVCVGFGVMLTKEKAVHTTLCTTYVEKE
jgi:hypothetical protein